VLAAKAEELATNDRFPLRYRGYRPIRWQRTAQPPRSEHSFWKGPLTISSLSHNIPAAGKEQAKKLGTE